MAWLLQPIAAKYVKEKAATHACPDTGPAKARGKLSAVCDRVLEGRAFEELKIHRPSSPRIAFVVH